MKISQYSNLIRSFENSNFVDDSSMEAVVDQIVYYINNVLTPMSDVDADDDNVYVRLVDHHCLCVFNVFENQGSYGVEFFGVTREKYRKSDFSADWIRDLKSLRNTNEDAMMDKIFDEFLQSSVEHMESILPTDRFSLPANKANFDKWIKKCLSDAEKNEDANLNKFYDVILRAVESGR